MAAQTIHAVIQMNCFQSGKSDHLIKFMKHTIQVMDNIISSIPHMTGIQTDAQFIILLHPVNDLANLLKRCSHLRTFTSHGFQKNYRTLLFCKHFVENLRNLGNPYFCSLTYMTSRMKIIIIPRCIFHTLQVICHNLPGKISQIFFGRACIHGIRSVCHQFPEMILSGQFQKLLHIPRSDLFRLAASRIPGKKRECIPAVFQHLTTHSSVAFGRTCMISDI